MHNHITYMLNHHPAVKILRENSQKDGRNRTKSIWNMNTPTLIASYPRSGSTYLRFLLTNIFYPDKEHDINSVNRHIPTIESKDEIFASIPNPRFYKTHQLRNPSNAILLHRHVGDCLISEFNFHKNYWDYEGDIEQFLNEVDYGKGWRTMIDHYYPCRTIEFENLVKRPSLVLPRLGITGEIASDIVKRCTFDNLQKQDSTFFRSGKIGQWKELSEDIQEKIIEKNWMHLKILGYKI